MKIKSKSHRVLLVLCSQIVMSAVAWAGPTKVNYDLQKREAPDTLPEGKTIVFHIPNVNTLTHQVKIEEQDRIIFESLYKMPSIISTHISGAKAQGLGNEANAKKRQ